ncbi:lipopolysaccharide biosynthesis protein [Halostella salina]|uniref:lipopolysaccharide biosynthesis protein n=1 Tax=Halostella salina TaxID=1547897 RepID=UPI000EF82F01|nr:oligosaccharide flippase family protein [Halostella salina]
MGRSLIEGFVSILGSRLLVSVISIVTLPFIVRVLGPGGYGDYAFIMSVLSLSIVVVSSGVTEGVQKYIGENRDATGWYPNVFGFYARLATVLAVAGAGGVVLLTGSGVVQRLFSAELEAEFYLLAVLLVVIQYRMLARRTLMGYGLERYSETLEAVNEALSRGVGLGLAAVGYGVVGMLGGIAVANVVIAAVGLSLVFRRVPVRSVLTLPPSDFPRDELLSFNVLNIVLVLLTMSLFHVDIVMLRTFAGSEQTGYYKAALSLAEYLWIVPISLQTLLLHSASTLWSDEAYERINELAAQVTRYTMLFSGLLAVGIATLADRFVPLYYGSDFAPVIGPLIWLLPGTIGFAAARPLIAISQARGNLLPLIVATGSASLLNLALNAALIPQYAMVGAAVATSVGYGSMLVFHVVTARRIGYDPLGDVRVGRVVATTIVTAAVVVSLSAAITGDLLALVLVPLVGFAVHLIAALLSGAIDGWEVRTLLTRVGVVSK